jgi:beta-phosphoglucomutase-like phosphatase (HAD superfamily)
MAVIAVDFDHTLVEGEKPIEYAREAINILRENGHKIIIHSCNETSWIKKVLDNADMRYDHIWTKADGNKPLADIYIDDKGFRFTGNWRENVEQVLLLIDGFDNRKW